MKIIRSINIKQSLAEEIKKTAELNGISFNKQVEEMLKKSELIILPPRIVKNHTNILIKLCEQIDDLELREHFLNSLTEITKNLEKL